jgi:ribosomal-protein-alanine N-acetyltransferase
MGEAIVLQTAKMELRHLRPSDRDEFVRMYAITWPFWEPWMPARKAEETFDLMFQQTLERTERELSQDTGRLLAGFTASGELAGIFALFNIVRGVFHNAHCGWRVVEPLTKKGYGMEGLTAMLGLAFGSEPEGLALHRVQANVMPENVASVRLAEKAGFRREGLARNYLRINGAWRDHILFAKLVDEHVIN